MKKNYLILATAALVFAGCASDDFVGLKEDPAKADEGKITFTSQRNAYTRATTGKEAADLLGGSFILEGVKCEETSTTFSAATTVFDNYKVVWQANTAGTTTDNTDDWKYVGVEKVTDLTDASEQSIKYWDYSANNYQFVAFSTGNNTLITTGNPTSGNVLVTKIDKSKYGNDTDGAYKFSVANVDDLAKCYYTDTKKVESASFGQPVTLSFKSMSSKIKVGFYETIPGYKVSDVKFFTETPATRGETGATTTAALYAGSATIPTSGSVKVYYYDDGNAQLKADNTSSSTDTKVQLGTITGDISISSTAPSFAGTGFTAVMPNTSGTALNLCVNFTLTSTDGSGEKINVYSAKAAIPASYTQWNPNYAYTYIFKISDNTNGFTATSGGAEGLFPITFDAAVADSETEGTQETVTTVATPSITTYQEGYTGGDYAAGNAKKIEVRVMNDGAAVTSLTTANTKLYVLNKDKTEAEVIDKLQTGRGDFTMTDPVSPQTMTITDGKLATITTGTTAATFAFVYDYTSGNPAPSYFETYLAEQPEDFVGNYYVKAGESYNVTTDSTAFTAGYYYIKNNNHSYAVKVIKVAAAS